jgi:PCO_ADO
MKLLYCKLLIVPFFHLVLWTADRLAKLHADTVFNAPCANSILYPETGGNMHCFTAVTDCAVLDVLGPPYSTEDDRDCTYYDAFPFSEFSGNLSLSLSLWHCFIRLIGIDNYFYQIGNQAKRQLNWLSPVTFWWKKITSKVCATKPWCHCSVLSSFLW